MGIGVAETPLSRHRGFLMSRVEALVLAIGMILLGIAAAHAGVLPG
jgi:hypothetical protein